MRAQLTVSSGVTHVSLLSLVMGHFFPKHQCWGTPRHRLPEPTSPEPGCPVYYGPSTAPGGRPAQCGQAGGGPPGGAVSHQGLPGKAASPTPADTGRCPLPWGLGQEERSWDSLSLKARPLPLLTALERALYLFPWVYRKAPWAGFSAGREGVP